MNLVFLKPEQDLNIYFDTDLLFRFPRIHKEQRTALPKVNVIENNDAFQLEAETLGMTQKDVSIEFLNDILSLKVNRE
jgi:HSP20 family molecular chaperone IbpA